MKALKTLVILFCMTFGLSIVAEGQIYCNDICYYISADGSKCSAQVIKFDGSTLCVWSSVCEIEKCLKKDRDYFEHMTWHEGDDPDDKYAFVRKYEYVRSMSTDKREVYKRTERKYVRAPNGLGGSYYTNNAYVAVSKDKSSAIFWFTVDDGEPQAKYTLFLVSKDEFLPKFANYDFLNE